MKLIIISCLIFISSNAFAKGMIFSLGAGVWSPQETSVKINNVAALKDFEEAKFARLSHEGLIGGNFLYVFSAGINVAKANASFEYEGENSTSSISELKSEISMVEARVGFKYNLINNLVYVGGGGILGDFQISYDRDAYVASGEDTVNYVASENQNYIGHYLEAGLMLLASNWGLRFGGEFNSATIQKNVQTLSSTQPELISSKVYMEILWKN